MLDRIKIASHIPPSAMINGGAFLLGWCTVFKN
jgi:hypothetical protein